MASLDSPRSQEPREMRNRIFLTDARNAVLVKEGSRVLKQHAHGLEEMNGMKSHIYFVCLFFISDRIKIHRIDKTVWTRVFFRKWG